MHIIGTAGHVDHGKSSLVKVLTGTDPDRFSEEQLRGMTLDLGFAHLCLPDGQEAGIIDVPGHERFLHNMLAGASGMELLLLVVAANEGVMPQTLEHLEILRFLNISRTLIVVTKCDMIAQAGLDAAVASIHQALVGTLAADARSIAVSNRDCSGIDALRIAIAEELGVLAPRDVDAPVYMPIDRVFSLPGHGTVVTGTLMQGKISLGDHLRLAPSQKNVRVRSIQVFGTNQDQAFGGQRVALSLPGVARGEIARGEVLADLSFEARDHFAVRFVSVASGEGLLRRRTPVRVYVGADEILGTLTLPEFPELTHATLQLNHRVLAFPGVRFVCRRISPKTLLGGGEIISHSDASVAQEAPSDIAGAVFIALSAQGYEPSDVAALSFATNLRDEVVRDALAELESRGALLAVQKPVGYITRTVADAFLANVVEQLASHHSAAPWSLGMTALALSRALQLPEPQVSRLIMALAEEGGIARRAGYFANLDHTPRLSAQQRAFFDEFLPIKADEPLLPSPALPVFDAMKRSRIEGLALAYDTLCATGAIVKVEQDLYRGAQIAQIHAKLEAWLRTHVSITVAQFRDLLGITRKYAVPLLEWFDGRGITLRNGDIRILRTSSTQRVTI